jgi:hypothetical protein
MGRYTFPAFNTSTRPRYVVLWDPHWQLLEVQRLEPAADLSGAMAATIERLEGEGWQAEGTPEYGFTFIQRASERRLLMLTPRALLYRPARPCRLAKWTPIALSDFTVHTSRGMISTMHCDLFALRVFMTMQPQSTKRC